MAPKRRASSWPFLAFSVPPLILVSSVQQPTTYLSKLTHAIRQTRAERGALTWANASGKMKNGRSKKRLSRKGMPGFFWGGLGGEGKAVSAFVCEAKTKGANERFSFAFYL